jgi:4'-phosphopantetheinyl transferase
MTVPGNLWGPPPADLRLSWDDIHVWRASLDQPAVPLEQLERTLSGDERERSARFYFERDRQRYIVGRGTLRIILSRYLAIEPGQLQFRYGTHGKPALALATGGERLRFNLSHSQDLALYAVGCDREVGVDLEYARRVSDIEQIAERFFSPREYAAFQTLSTDQRFQAFFDCWTRKEAYIKAIGDGFSIPLDQFDVSLAPGEPARLMSIGGDPLKASGWSLRELLPAPGFVAALAVEGQGLRLNCWDV